MVGIGMGMGVHFVTEPIAEVVPDVGWLKGTFTADQGGIATSGIQQTFSTSYTETAGDYHTTTMKIYLQNTTGDNWDEDDPVRVYTKYFAYGTNQDVPQETLTDWAAGNSAGAPSAPYSNLFSIYFPGLGDRPKAGAIFWIKDIVFKVYNASDVLLYTYTSDFSSGLDGFSGISVGNNTITLEYNQEFLS